MRIRVPQEVHDLVDRSHARLSNVMTILGGEGHAVFASGFVAERAVARCSVPGLYGPPIGGWDVSEGDEATDGPRTGLTGGYAALAIGFGGGSMREPN